MSKPIILVILLLVSLTVKGYGLLCFAMHEGQMQVQYNETEQTGGNAYDQDKFTFRKLVHYAKTDPKYAHCSFVSRLPNCYFEFNLSSFINKTLQPEPIDNISMSMCYLCNNKEAALNVGLYYFRKDLGPCTVLFSNTKSGNYEFIPLSSKIIL